MGLNRNINDDSTLAYLFNKTRQGASDALQKAIDAINATIATIQTTLNNKVDKSGDTMTGNLTVDRSSGTSEADIMAKGKAGTVYLYSTGSATGNRGIYCENASGTSKAVITIDQSNNVTLGGRATNVTGTVAIANGGTGATTAANALTNLGAVNKAGDTMTGNLEIELSGTPHFYLNNNSADTSLATDTATRQWSFYNRDKNDKIISYWETTFNTAGTAATSFRARRIVNGSSADNGVNFSITADGTRTVSVSSPAAWRTALGLGGMATVASPVPIANGGTGQTGVSTTTSASQIVTAASGFTVTSAAFYQWGKVAYATLAFKKTAAQTSAAEMIAGTMVAGKRPINYAIAQALSGNISWADIASSGNVRFYGTWPAGGTYWIHAIYLLP